MEKADLEADDDPEEEMRRSIPTFANPECFAMVELEKQGKGRLTALNIQPVMKLLGKQVEHHFSPYVDSMPCLQWTDEEREALVGDGLKCDDFVVRKAPCFPWGCHEHQSCW